MVEELVLGLVLTELLSGVGPAQCGNRANRAPPQQFTRSFARHTPQVILPKEHLFVSACVVIELLCSR